MTPNAKLTVAIDGMSCSSCSNTVLNAITPIEGVCSASVNLTTNSALIFLNTDIVTEEVILNAINEIGFDAVQISVEKIENDCVGDQRRRSVLMKFDSALSCFDGLQALENKIKEINGVYDLSHDLEMNYINVNINEYVLGPRLLVRICEDFGLNVEVSLSSSFILMERMERKNKIETRNNHILLGISSVLTLPILFLTMLPSNLIWPGLMNQITESGSATWKSVVLLVLSTPIQFGVGFRFYIKAYHSIRANNLGMDFLIISGTSAAYIFALVAFIRACLSRTASDMDVDYCETSAVLLTVILLGKCLESLARNQTTAALRKLSSQRGAMARLVQGAEMSSDKGEEKELAGNTAMDTVSLGAADTGTRPLVGERKGDGTGLGNDDTGDKNIPSSLLQYGDIVRLLAGDAVPADGEFLGTWLAADESLLTGESRAVEKSKGSAVLGGSLVVEGGGLMRVLRCGDDSALGRILCTLQQAQYSRPPIQDLADEIAKVERPLRLYPTLRYTYILTS